MRSAAELDRMHDEIVARFPLGLTPLQFKLVTLASADEDGRVYPLSIADFFHRHSLLWKMWFDGLLSTAGGYNEPIIFYITDKGRLFLEFNAQGDTP